MRLLLSIILFASFLPATPLSAQQNAGAATKTVSLIIGEASHPRIAFGAEKLTKTLVQAGYTVKRLHQNKVASASKPLIIVGKNSDELLKKSVVLYKIPAGKKAGKEGFTISSKNNIILIQGTDFSGALYGCLELAEQVKFQRKLPINIAYTDQPEMVLRGACIGVQKPAYLPGRHVYEYPYTPETFPWFYDRALWIKYLDSMVENRMNSLYLWNGHPFAARLSPCGTFNSNTMMVIMMARTPSLNASTLPLPINACVNPIT